jgi:amidase
MATNVADTAFLFAVQAGPDVEDPLTLPEPGETFLDGLVPLPDLKGLRIAYSPDLHGLPIAPDVARVIAQCAGVCADLGASVVTTAPDLSRAMYVFQVQRAANLAHLGHALDRSLPDWKTHAKDTAVWNIEKGQALSASEVLQAEIIRSEIYAEVAHFFEDYDALILPAAQVAPFDTRTEWIDEINGVAMETYIDWMTVCCAITVTGLPAISVPGGFTPDGLPVGLQIVGQPRGDLALLRLAGCFEAATMHHSRTPELNAEPGA